MNNAEITQARSPVAEHFEIIRPEDLPSVPQVEEPDADATSLSNETGRRFPRGTVDGLLRFAQFLKKSKQKKSLNPKVAQAIEAYETVANFKNRVTPGQVLDHWR